MSAALEAVAVRVPAKAGLVSERRMESRGVEALPPFGDGAARMVEAEEQALV